MNSQKSANGMSENNQIPQPPEEKQGANKGPVNKGAKGSSFITFLALAIALALSSTIIDSCDSGQQASSSSHNFPSVSAFTPASTSSSAKS